MRFPKIDDVAADLRAINKQQLNRDDADEGIDVRLQVHPDGDWGVKSGSSDYDQDHRGYWGASSVPGDNRRFDSKAVARDLIDQAKDHAADNDEGDLDEPQTAREAPVRSSRLDGGGIEEFKDFLDKAVILVAGENDGYIDPNAEEVHVAIVVNVTGYGPHPGAIYVDQNRFHAGPDKALEEAHEILEEWEREHYPMSEEDEEHRTETFDGRTWKLPAGAFCDAIYNTKAEQFIDVLEEEEEDEVDEGVLEENDEDVPLIRISFTRIIRGDSEDSDDYEEEHGWIDEDGVEFEPDEADLEDGMSESESIVAQAIKFLENEGAAHASSSHFHPGVWYTTEYETTDYGTGEEEERSFHLKGFQPEEEAEIFKAITRRR
jgi:hypothetical protein